MIKERGILFAALSSVFSSIATVIKGGALRYINPFMALSVEGIIAGISLFSLSFIKKEKFKFNILRENWRTFFALVLTRQILGNLLFTLGLSLTDSIKVVFFTKAEPYFVVFWAWMLHKEKVQGKHLLLLVIHILGAIVLSTGGKIEEFGKAQLGDLLVISAIALTAYSYLPSAKLVQKINPIALNAPMLLIGGLFYLPFALYFTTQNQWASTVGWQYLILNVILFHIFGLTFLFVALKTVKSWMASALRAIGPLVAAPFAFYFFGETLDKVQIIGGIIVLATSFLIAREHIRSK